MTGFPDAGALRAEADAAHGRHGETRLAAAPRLRPRDAATLIVLDRTGPAPRVLMGKRHEGHKFMPGKFVFPGGRAEREDAAIPAGSELRDEVTRALVARTTRGNAARARRLAMAAIRETFEETGLVIGQPGLRPHAATGPWAEFLATGHLPDLAAIHYLARAVTPPGRTKRFDTRFFVVDAGAIRHKVGDIVGPDSELTELAWLTLEDTATMPLPVITRIILGDLHNALTEGWPDRIGPVPYYYRKGAEFQRELIG